MLANTALADQKDKAFQINELDPFKDTATAIAQQKAAGLQNLQGVANSVSGAFANDATANLYKDLFGTGEKLGTTSPNNQAGTDYASIVKQLMATSGFQNAQSPAANMNLGANNFNTVGLPNYSLNAPLFGNQKQSQYLNGFNPFSFNPYGLTF